MITGFRAALPALALVSVASALVAQVPMSTERLARVRLVVTTTGGGAAVAVTGATVARYIGAVAAGPPAAAVRSTGRTVQLSRSVRGQSAEARFDVILADVAADTPIVWNVSADAGADTALAVYAMNDAARPALVDRFTSTTSAARFTTAAALV